MFLFFFNDTATTEIYTLSLHDALPISALEQRIVGRQLARFLLEHHRHRVADRIGEPVHAAHEHLRLALERSEEHTSELQSQSNLVCRLLLEKKKTELDNIIQLYT